MRRRADEVAALRRAAGTGDADTLSQHQVLRLPVLGVIEQTAARLGTSFCAV